MIHSDEMDKIAAALVAVQAEVPKIPKDATNPFFKSKYADLGSVVDTAAPIVTAHGLAVSQFLGFDGDHDTLTTIILHTSGQYLSDTARMHLVKDDPQGHGSATTYMRRYSYMACLGLVADEDDDGNAGSQQKRQTARPKPAATTGMAGAKQQLLAACGGDKSLAGSLWPTDGVADQAGLDRLLALAASSKPFEEGK